MTTICVDVMGADKEPAVLLEGVAQALEDDPELEVLVAGNADVVEPFAASHTRASSGCALCTDSTSGKRDSVEADAACKPPARGLAA